MPDTVHCDIHGDSAETFVCTHLTGDSHGLGFNSDVPSEEEPFPSAWCDDCEIIRAAHDGWNDESQKLTKISLLCSGCYNRSRIRNTHTETTLADLADLRWKCGSCDEWHTGPMLDVGFERPGQWSSDLKKKKNCFLNEDYCDIEHRDYFVRGVIPIPILGTDEYFMYGVWGSLSKDSFDKMLNADENPKRDELPPMFSYLCNSIDGYPDTQSLKMDALVQEVGARPHFRLHHADHPFVQEFENGIDPEGVKEIMSHWIEGFE